MYPNEEKILKSQALMACESIRSRAYKQIKLTEQLLGSLAIGEDTRAIMTYQGYGKKRPRRVAVIVR